MFVELIPFERAEEGKAKTKTEKQKQDDCSSFQQLMPLSFVSYFNGTLCDFVHSR